jgi:biopolymer transport protein ExbD
MDDDIIAEINLTPLVDVSLVLVIIFMVVAPMFSKILKPLILPSASRASITESTAINISLFPDGTLAVGSNIVEMGRLAEAVQKEMDSGHPPWALVRAGTSVPHGRVMDVVRKAKQSGVQRIAFATQPAPPIKQEKRP